LIQNGFWDSNITGIQTLDFDGEPINVPLGDRAQPAEFWRLWYKMMATTGYNPSVGSYLQVSPSDALSVQIAPGEGMIEGTYFNNDDLIVLPLAAADPSLPRFDRVVFRKDVQARDVYALILTGVAAANPAPPEIIRNESFYDIVLADVRLDAGMTAATAQHIFDRRPNSALCGPIGSLIKPDTSGWTAQFDALIAALIATQTGQQNSWTTQMTTQQNTFNTSQTDRQTAWLSWWETVKVDLATYAYFDFDNIAALSGTTRDTVLNSDNTVSEVITTTTGGANVATRTTASAGGQTTVRTVVYNGDGTILRDTTTTAGLDADGKFAEVTV
jgi:hypothetical protein